MSISNINNVFVFPNGNEFSFEHINSHSFTEERIVQLGKFVKQFKGACKAQVFKNKKDEIEGVVIKIKNVFGMIYYLGLSADKCFELIPTSKKDRNSRIKSLKELKI